MCVRPRLSVVPHRRPSAFPMSTIRQPGRRSVRWGGGGGALVSLDCNRPGVTLAAKPESFLVVESAASSRSSSGHSGVAPRYVGHVGLRPSVDTAALRFAFRRWQAVATGRGRTSLCLRLCAAASIFRRRRRRGSQAPRAGAALATLLAMLTGSQFARRAFRRWRFAAARRRCRVAALAAVAATAAGRLAQWSFRHWRCLARRHAAAHALRRIRRSANAVVAQRLLQRWQRWRLARRAAVWGRLADMHLAARYLGTWSSLRQRRHRHRAAEAACAAEIVLPAIAALACRSFRRWTAYPPIARRRHRAQRFVEACADVSRLWASFRRWRRFRKLTLPEIARLRRAALRASLERGFRRLLHFAVRRQTGQLLAQRTLAAVARTAFLRWQRLALSCPHLRAIRFAAESMLARRMLRRWRVRMEWSLRAVQCEQRHFVVLVQRYFLRWRWRRTPSSTLYEFIPT